VPADAVLAVVRSVVRAVPCGVAGVVVVPSVGPFSVGGPC